MKKVAIIMALLLFQTQVLAAATNANYNKKPAQKTQTQQVNQVKQQTQKPAASVSKEDDFLLKYNINDLESAPWLNDGKRKL